MVEPVLRTTSNPLDRNTLTEWRDRTCRWIGRAYSSLDSGQSDELNRIIDEAHEFISQRLGHQHLKRTTTVSLVASQAKYALPADHRAMRMILEGSGDARQQAKIVTDEQYWEAFPFADGATGNTTHPWTDQNDPRWFQAGVDNSNPPVAVWQRVPTPTSAEAGSDNVTVVYRPYMGLLANDSFNELSPAVQDAVMEHVRVKWAAFTKDPLMSAYRQLREDSLAAHNIKDTKETEAPDFLEIPSRAARELSMFD